MTVEQQESVIPVAQIPPEERPAAEQPPDLPTTIVVAPPTTVPAPSSAPLTYTSPAGVVLTFQNAGHHLSRWFQASGHTPTYNMEDVLPPGITEAPISKKAAKKARLDESDEPAAVPTGPPLGSMRVCTLDLPYTGSVRSGLWPNKGLAKQHASFEACKVLMDKGEVDTSFQPAPSHPRGKTFEERLETKSRCNYRWESRKLAIQDQLPQGTGQGDYEYKTTPEFWTTCPPFQPDHLWASVFQLSPDGEGNYDNHPECRMMCLITSRPLPFWSSVGETVVRMGVGEQPVLQASMRLINGGKMEPFQSGTLEQAQVFTEKLMRAQIQKPLMADLAHVKWLLVPLRRSFKAPTKEIVSQNKGIKLRLKDIAWKEVDAVTDGPLTMPFTHNDMDILQRQCKDRMSTVPSEMVRRNYIVRIRTDLNPSSPHPDHPEETILQALEKEPNPLPELSDPSQPILEVEPAALPKTGSYITSLSIPDEKRPKLYLIPEFEHWHCIPSSVHRTTSTMPFFIHQLESMLVAWEASEKLCGSVVRPEYALQALTAPAGMNVNSWTYERLEILGDTLLKFFATLHFYLAGGGADCQDDPLKTWQDRHKVVSNKTLAHNCIKLGLVNYVRDRRVKVKEWAPRDWDFDTWIGGTAMKKHLKTSEDKSEFRNLGDKLLADVVEAMIGASYLPNKDMDNVITTLHNLTVPLTLFKSWGDIKHVLQRENEDEEEEAKDPDLPAYMNFFAKSKMQYEVFGYTFKRRKTFEDVFSLSSKRETRMKRERYKMLGNAVLDVYIIDYLYENHPTEGPGSLSNMKTFRTTEGLRCALAVELGLQDLVIDGDDKTRRELGRATYFINEARKKADAGLSEEEQGEVHYWEEVAVNHITGSIMEILLGAILDDSDFDLEPTRKIFFEKILPFTEKYCKGPANTDMHPKGQITRWMQAKGCMMYSLDVEGPKLNIGTFKVHDKEIARESAFTTHLAVRNVCNAAIRKLKDEGGLEELCDCASFKKVVPDDKIVEIFGKSRRERMLEAQEKDAASRKA
ncbi:hypothetical protein L202_00407 [Cryptococcus amylolentus CBS 6039]|uniref:RNase III domain-containing protein n=1 Tax=Cryptococcus amylolentus CBS 6039 TaxID=1295533 RepID=A0A1E3I757_9TREE|nr:hypothetical protein L202_00407 [Cryptococcus amylolentus CBS 6039]ODN84460.1 hypothetical protein L202_00407 [Cryptococcus amylolentus CBS 6039]